MEPLSFRSAPALFALCAGLVAAALTPSAAERRKPEADPGLARAVTVSRARIYLGELLEEVSRQTGVPLRADGARAPLDGIDLTVLIHDQPAARLLEGVRQLLEHRFNRFEWQAEGERGYVLRCQKAPEEASLAVRQSVSAAWVQDLRGLRDLARLPPAVRQARGAPFRMFPGGLGPEHDGYLEIMAQVADPDLEALSRATPAYLDVTRLGPVALETLRSGIDPPPPVVPGLRPRLHVSWDSDRPAPILWIENDRGYSRSVLGGSAWNSHWLRTNGAGWVDRLHPPVEATRRRDVQSRPPAGELLPPCTLAGWMKHAHQKQRLQILADAVYPWRSGPGVRRLGATPEATVHTLVTTYSLHWKEHAGLHLLRDGTAMVHPRRHLVPWQLVRRLRTSAERHDGVLTLDELAELAELKREQLLGLSEEFPAAESDSMARWQGILRFYSHLHRDARRQLVKPEGLPFHEAGLVARAALAEGGDPQNQLGLALLAADPARAVVWMGVVKEKRPVREAGRIAQREVRYLVWEVRLPDQKPRRGAKSLEPRRSLEPEEPPAAPPPAG